MPSRNRPRTLRPSRYRPDPAVDVRGLRAVVGWSAVAVTVVQSVTAVLGLRRGRRDYADAAWGPGLASVAVVSAITGRGDAVRRWTLAALVAGWATRLERLMLGRLRGSDEEDARYTEFLEGDGTPAVVTKVFVTQGLAQLVVSAPIQLAAVSTLPRGARRWVFPVGVALATAGAVVEATADRQKKRYMDRDRDERPDVLDTGLWGWSRHPNYLGDSIVWDGVWLASAASPGALATLPAPLAMSWFLVFATGAKRTEERMEDRPAYQDYQRRVPFFFPWPSSS